eukprot:Rhum_TRINITY_DN14606_c4_g1::Rhum_TRINITY_DN14606_c4_g1_i1::g.104122::m.104122/K02209/MCM5, CDC46; DNA replication licensing factor MCM5
MDQDEGRVTYSMSGRRRDPMNTRGGGTYDNSSMGLQGDGDNAGDIQSYLRDFIRLYRKDGGNARMYWEQLKDNVHLGRNYIEVDMRDIATFNPQCGELLTKDPNKWLPVFEEAAREVAKSQAMFGTLDSHDVQVQLVWDTKTPYQIRDIPTLTMGSLCTVPGITVKCSETKQKVVRAVLQCSSCFSEIHQTVPPNAGFPQTPPTCQASGAKSGSGGCRPNPYIVRPDKCEYINVQYLKLQELPESVPTGELPRHIEVQLDRELVGKVNPGQRLVIVGINSIFRDQEKGTKGRQAVGIRRRYVKGVGLMVMGSGGVAASVNSNFSSLRPTGTLLWDVKEEKLFKELAQRPNLYEELSKSLAPSIFGHEDIKKACVCQLFGGTRKMLTDGGRLRGDMNLLLIGDPSTAKSQLLKAVYNVTPIGVYTSGKGSSAAGLTAAVSREQGRGGKGGFYLEGGSMVLADGGIVCIDEFDKMRDSDTVAIHEAMEQQTISVAKAGLATVLNSRTSVLAAANPTMGCYDPLKSNEEQMNFKSTIMSRFDLIFKVLDPADRERDMKIASHVVGLHKSGSRFSDTGHSGQGNSALASLPAPRVGAQQATTQTGKSDVSVSVEVLKSYIAYARAQVVTKLDGGAEEHLKDYYVQTRKAANEVQKDEDSSVIRITVRQLESLVRLTESLAKMRLQKQATSEDAKEAIRLYNVATVQAIQSGVVDASLSGGQEKDILELEEKIERKLPLGTQIRTMDLVRTLQAQGHDEAIIERTMLVMSKRGVLQYMSHKRYVTRKSTVLG